MKICYAFLLVGLMFAGAVSAMNYASPDPRAPKIGQNYPVEEEMRELERIKTKSPSSQANLLRRLKEHLMFNVCPGNTIGGRELPIITTLMAEIDKLLGLI